MVIPSDRISLVCKIDTSEADCPDAVADTYFICKRRQNDFHQCKANPARSCTRVLVPKITAELLFLFALRASTKSHIRASVSAVLAGATEGLQHAVWIVGELVPDHWQPGCNFFMSKCVFHVGEIVVIKHAGNIAPHACARLK